MMIHSYRAGLRHTRGTFMVEFGVMAFAFSLILAFCGDVVIRMSTKGKLDRMAYSAVTIMKERTALFDGADFASTDNAQFSQLVQIVRRSFVRTLGSFDETKFGVTLEVQTFQSNGNSNALITKKQSDKGIACEPASALDPTLTVETSDGSKSSLYRVTLCYQTDSWFGTLLGKDYGLVSSNAVSIGR